MLLNLKLVHYHTIRFFNKTATVSSLYWKLCHTALVAISASKIIIIVLFCKLIQMMLEAFYRFNITKPKIMDEELKPSHTYHKSIPFVVSKDEWDTKEGPGRFMKNALYVQQHGKGHLSG